MRRWSGIAGIVFVVLAVVSRLVRGSVPDPEKRDALAKFTKYYAHSSHTKAAVAAVVIGFVALFAFAWFIGGVWSRLRTAQAATTIPLIIVAIGSGAFVALGMAEHVLSDVVGVTLNFSTGYTLHKGFDAATALVLNEAGRAAFLGAMLAVGAATAATGIVILATRVLPVWLAWVGFAIAVLCLPAIPPLTFVTAILLAIWTLVISGLMVRADPSEVPTAA